MHPSVIVAEVSEEAMSYICWRNDGKSMVCLRSVPSISNMTPFMDDRGGRREGVDDGDDGSIGFDIAVVASEEEERSFWILVERSRWDAK